MSFSTVLFDLDGTLLPMDLDVFIKHYFGSVAQKLVPHGFDPDEFLGTLWKGTGAMLKNDGTKTNEQAFWHVLNTAYGKEKARECETILEEFYRCNFESMKSFCGFDPRAAETVRYIRSIGYRVSLATNPLFPHMATESRIRWAGLEPEDFEQYTTYENSSFSKPNPGYYIEVAKNLGVRPGECLMVGNDTTDDLSARKVGMKVFILTDGLINKKNVDLSDIPHGSFEELKEFVLRAKTETAV